MTLLDTDTLSLLMHGHLRVAQRVARDRDVTISIVTRIEVLQGRFDFILKASDGAEMMRAQQWLDQNEEFLGDFDVIPFDEAAAAEFDRLRLDNRLKKIGRADLLIACIALAHRAKVVTRNLRHFRQVPGLAVENWAD